MSRTTYTYKLYSLATLVVLTLAPVVYSQSTKPADGTTKPSPTEDETVTLSEFSVSSGATHGYVASESMTGTRVATKIADLPFSVNVVTSEFFKILHFSSSMKISPILVRSAASIRAVGTTSVASISLISSATAFFV